ncbi:MAG: hypothetical protein KDI51_19855, partial [Xanthomonadales bacterium]|nr:hypothetical protein [Xanthomonadales bacterium]
MLRCAMALAATLSLCGSAEVHAETLAQQAFADLASLAGEWEGTYANGRSHRVNFALTAGGSVIIETWTMSPTRQSLTLYALDGERLLATHYCPQGNQPLLVLTERDADDHDHFAFLDGTNLQDPNGSHQHALE